MELSVRMRRLRRTSALRGLVRETFVTAADLILPVFVTEGAPGPIASMPGISRHSVDSAILEIAEALTLGIRAFILFGIPNEKEALGVSAAAVDGIVPKAVKAIKKEFGDEVIIVCDVCLCEYTSHGHCGILQGEYVANDLTLPLLCDASVCYADAGADIVAPSDMMDGRIKAIRLALDGGGHSNIPIMSYAAKFASGYYGPFREAADSAPAFGDRRSYQMDPANRREAIRETLLDIDEGADIVMVKPALAYLDIIRDIRERVELPVAAYNVSGEYSMVKAAAANGWIDEQRVIAETLTSIKRAGADIIITYHAKEYLSNL